MEDKIRAQLLANQHLLGESDQTWDEKVDHVTLYFLVCCRPI